MHGHESRIMTVKMYPKSRRILSGDEGGHVLVWNASSDKKKKGKRWEFILLLNIIWHNFILFCLKHFINNSHFSHCRQSWGIESREYIPSTLAAPIKKSGEKCPSSQSIFMMQDPDISSFDGNEMPSNAINTNISDKPSRIAGLVLCRRTGFVVAHQRGTLKDIEITWFFTRFLGHYHLEFNLWYNLIIPWF